jgi:hypothetical protein
LSVFLKKTAFFSQALKLHWRFTMVLVVSPSYSLPNVTIPPCNPDNHLGENLSKFPKGLRGREEYDLHAQMVVFDSTNQPGSVSDGDSPWLCKTLKCAVSLQKRLLSRLQDSSCEIQVVERVLNRTRTAMNNDEQTINACLAREDHESNIIKPELLDRRNTSSITLEERENKFSNSTRVVVASLIMAAPAVGGLTAGLGTVLGLGVGVLGSVAFVAHRYFRQPVKDYRQVAIV